MEISQAVVIGAFLLPVLTVLTGYLRLDVAAMLAACLLAVSQFFGLGIFSDAGSPEVSLAAFSGFAQPAVIVLFSLFTITASLEKSGFSRWITDQLLKIARGSVNRLIFLFTGTAALLSQVMNGVAAGAFLLPSAMEASRRTGNPPSKLLIPVSFGSLLGGMATYFTTANILASDLLLTSKPPQDPLGIFSFALTGGLAALIGLGFISVFGNYLLPERESPAAFRMNLSTGSELEELYKLGERTWKIHVDEGNPLRGKSVKEIAFGEKYGLTLAAVLRKEKNLVLPGPEWRIQKGDVLIVIGREERIEDLCEDNISAERDKDLNTLSQRGLSVFEVVVAPRSTAVSKTLKELDFRKRFGWSAIALQRGTDRYRTDVGKMRLAVGDALLVVGEIDQLDPLRGNRDFILLRPSSADQPLNFRETLLALAFLLGAIAASAAGVPVYLSLLAAALLCVVTRTVTFPEIYESIEWQAIFVIGSMYGLSLALVQTGLADLAGEGMRFLADAVGPIGLAGGSFLISALLTQILGGQIVILVTGPIAIRSAINLGVNPQAIAVAAALGCSTSFLTPVAHSVNLLMVGPAGYKLEDFFRLGWRLFVLCFIAVLAGMILFWEL